MSQRVLSGVQLGSCAFFPMRRVPVQLTCMSSRSRFQVAVGCCGMRSSSRRRSKIGPDLRYTFGLALSKLGQHVQQILPHACHPARHAAADVCFAGGQQLQHSCEQPAVTRAFVQQHSSRAAASGEGKK